MKEQTYTNLLIILLLFLILGLYNGFTTPVIVIAVIFLLLLKTNSHTVGFYLLLYGGVLGGTIRSLYPFIPIWGLAMCLIGLYLVRDSVKQVVLKKQSSLFALLFLFLFLGISFILGPRTEFSYDKMFSILRNGFFYFFAYFTLANSDSIRLKDISYLLLFTSIFLISYAMNIYQIGPSSYLDFNWFRQGLTAYEYYQGEETLVSYQEVGMDATYAIALLLSFKKRPQGLYILLGIGILITLLSGARQSIAACILVIFLRYAYFNDAKALKKIMLLFFACVFVYIVYLLFESSNIEVISNTLESGDEQRTYIWLLSAQLFFENPLLGIGLGGFADYSPINPWPHNFVLEILCECGLLGLVWFSLITTIYIVRQRVRIKYITPTGMFYFLTLIPMIVRMMVSADLRLSIAIFCAIFAVSGIKYYNSRKI